MNFQDFEGMDNVLKLDDECLSNETLHYVIKIANVLAVSKKTFKLSVVEDAIKALSDTTVQAKLKSSLESLRLVQPDDDPKIQRRSRMRGRGVHVVENILVRSTSRLVRSSSDDAAAASTEPDEKDLTTGSTGCGQKDQLAAIVTLPKHSNVEEELIRIAGVDRTKVQKYLCEIAKVHRKLEKAGIVHMGSMAWHFGVDANENVILQHLHKLTPSENGPEWKKYRRCLMPPELAHFELSRDEPVDFPSTGSTTSIEHAVWGFGMLVYRLSNKLGSGRDVFDTSADGEIALDDLKTIAYKWEQHKIALTSQLEWKDAADLALCCLQTKPGRRPRSFEDVLQHPFFGGEATTEPQLEADAQEDMSDRHRQFIDTEAGLPESQPGRGRSPEPSQMHRQQHEVVSRAAAKRDFEGRGCRCRCRRRRRRRRLAPSLPGLPPGSANGERPYHKTGSGALRYLLADEHWIDFDSRQAVALHSAIVTKDSARVSELFETGAVHITMVDARAEVPTAPPLHCAAFAGDENVMQVLLDEIADSWPLDVRRDYLDQRTSLDYTAYMVALSCGHKKIAEMLASKGCSTNLKNSSGKTGEELLRAASNEKERSFLSPFTHGYKLHLSCKNLPQYLRLLEKMLDEDVAAGVRLWHAKQAVYHLGREHMKQLEATIEELQAKYFDIALHFTDFASCSLILRSKGIRASVVGQLGGGVSVCLRSLVDFEWGQDWDKFAETVGKALWGSKWYEVMSGEPWPDLQQKIESGEVKGAWPAARDRWGTCSSKLETVLLVAVPSTDNRNPARILPGRPDVYIIPRSDCTPGPEVDSNVYYSATNIKACLVLKRPTNADELAPQLKTIGRVLCATQYDKKGMTNLRLSVIGDNEMVDDIDQGERFSPKITQFVMTVAHPISAEDAVKQAHLSTLLPTFSSQQLWLEDVARFESAEMEAGILGVEQLLSQAYTMAYTYTTIEKASKICSPQGGIPAASDSAPHTLTMCLLPPSAKLLAWQSNAGGGFKQRVARLLDMDEHDVQAVILLGVPTCAIEEAECAHEAVFTLSEPFDSCTFLQPTDEGGAVYSNAHIAKVWTLEATAVSDARRALIDLQAEKTLTDAFAGKTKEQIAREIQELLTSTGDDV